MLHMHIKCEYTHTTVLKLTPILWKYFTAPPALSASLACITQPMPAKYTLEPQGGPAAPPAPVVRQLGTDDAGDAGQDDAHRRHIAPRQQLPQHRRCQPRRQQRLQ